ncbi:MAG: acyclic terpene utilization AtuA family protein [Candidatus Fermentithermobacillus carboniphilus]|uniref:Acyclic terpene utilization AtuA family protein n=1 Tax=Candidatus Fermentithermobacillus carboniphilus TaxID=3085328 RepID=A0AAT9LAU2_9FIRM|nr:MAG: acyclic terpene utilization AtuA family protein [Candidatus Fermentithermobacillus carboniphilus]
MSKKPDEVRIYSATSFVGHGVDEESLKRALQLHPDAIVAQGTTTDAGPYYLGTAKPVMAREALFRDLELIVTAAKSAGIPFIASVGGCGSNPTTELALDVLRDVCRKHGVRLKLGVIWSEISPQWLVDVLSTKAVRAPRILPHPRLEPFLSPDTVKKAKRIVAQVGPEVVMRLITRAPDLDGIITGRALDVGLYAALPLLHGFDKGLSMHFGKVMEDGALAATPGSGNDGLFGIIRKDHFDVFPVNPKRRCTPSSVVAHAFYERSDPTREANPGGDLDISSATYTQIDDRTVRVTGSRWVPAQEYRIKLEGVAQVGYRSICIGGVRDPRFIDNVDSILSECKSIVSNYFKGLSTEAYTLIFRVYGKNAVMGDSEPRDQVGGHEICLLIDVVAQTQDLADSICSFTSSTISHHGFAGRLSTAGNLAMPFSPGRAIPIGEVYQFTIWHALPLSDPEEPFRTEILRI